MKIIIQIAVFLMVFTLVPESSTFAENYHIAGYVLKENDSVPVFNQIIQIRDQSGAIIETYLTNNHGLFAGYFETSPVNSPVVFVEISRQCGDSVFFYSQQITLDNPYLTCNFFVCSGQPCRSNFGWQQQALNNLTFQFYAVTQGVITNWAWDFDDQTFSSEQNPVHVFDHPGHYQVKLTVAGQNCNNSRQKMVIVQNENCLARFTSEQLNQGNNFAVQFWDQSLGNPNEWFWEFDDGAISNERNPIHVYSHPGEFEVKLSIFGPGGCSNNTRQPINVVPPSQCFALFNTYQSQSPELLVNFTNLSIRQAENWLWDFGDGNVSNLENPTHTYENGADYFVKLTISGQACNDTYSRLLHLKQDSNCQADFTFQQNSILEPVIEFTNLSLNDSLLYSWDFGDGETSQEKSPLHQFPGAGVFSVMLKTIGFGCSDSLVKQIEVLEPPPCFADFSFTSQSPESPVIFFTNESSGMINTFHWNFGDNSFSDDENPVHTYSLPENYLVKLVIGAVGCTDSIEKTIQITEPVFCDAAFQIGQEYPQSMVITFTNESVGNNFTANWDFGDGTFSTLINPQHEYAVSGIYTVELIISTSDYCGDTVSKSLEILPPFMLSGLVKAGSNILKYGNVFLYKQELAGGLSIYGQTSLEIGAFAFGELTPGSYTLQAIPDFEFLPQPLIPNYFPTYAGEKMTWSEAQFFETDNLPESIEINLLHFDEFFDGSASISGKILLMSGNQDYPVTIYLTDETRHLLSYKIPDSQNEFEFLDIPYGRYKIYPEKAGRFSQPFNVELTAEKPGSHGIIFTETENAIIPDLTLIQEFNQPTVVLSPNPASDFVNVLLETNPQNNAMNSLTIYKYDNSRIRTFTFQGNRFIINVSDFETGLYFVEVNYSYKKIFKKLIIQH